ncbi:hypothetical protein JD969_04085 [Planctomycetota bacterium]|nr:hypothetical protein JD969_04085 [Planctomycetota bacterium]
MDEQIITAEPFADLIFNSNEALVSYMPIPNPNQSPDDLVGIVGLQVTELNLFSFTFWWWQEIFFLIAILTLFFTIYRLIKRRKFKDVRKGEPYCKRCGYNLTNFTSSDCPECGKKNVGPNFKHHKTMGHKSIASTLYYTLLTLSLFTLASLAYLEFTSAHTSGYKKWFTSYRWQSSRRSAFVYNQDTQLISQLTNRKWYGPTFKEQNIWSGKAYQLLKSIPLKPLQIALQENSDFTHEEVWGVYKTPNSLSRKHLSSSPRREIPDIIMSDSNPHRFYQYMGLNFSHGNGIGFAMASSFVWHNGNDLKIFHHPEGKQFVSELSSSTLFDDQYLLIRDASNGWRGSIIGDVSHNYSINYILVLDLINQSIIYQDQQHGADDVVKLKKNKPPLRELFDKRPYSTHPVQFELPASNRSFKLMFRYSKYALFTFDDDITTEPSSEPKSLRYDINHEWYETTHGQDKLIDLNKLNKHPSQYLFSHSGLRHNPQSILNWQQPLQYEIDSQYFQSNYDDELIPLLSVYKYENPWLKKQYWQRNDNLQHPLYARIFFDSKILSHPTSYKSNYPAIDKKRHWLYIYERDTDQPERIIFFDLNQTLKQN